MVLRTLCEPISLHAVKSQMLWPVQYIPYTKINTTYFHFPTHKIKMTDTKIFCHCFSSEQNMKFMQSGILHGIK